MLRMRCGGYQKTKLMHSLSRCKGGSEGGTKLNGLGKRGTKDMKEFALIGGKVALEPGLTVQTPKASCKASCWVTANMRVSGGES